tara:strand:+ start:916 stop:1794 length:879 start_codon:yes stop_codon:yes gene_type:complete
MEIFRNEKLSKHTTINLGGRAKKICFPKNIDELKSLLISFSGQKFIIIGNGSNVVFRDGGYDGIVVSLKKFNRETISIKNEKIIVGAGVSCSKFAKFLYKKKISGFEFLHGIPGTIGGAMAMNAGAFDTSIWDKITNCKVINNKGTIKIFNRKQISTLYRKVHINRKSYFIEAELLIDSKIKFKNNLILEYAIKRKSTQPVNQRSSGCIFKNPTTKYSASYLIEKSGLKSRKIGGIYISKKHSNYFINDGNGTSNDLEKLILLVKRTIKKEHNVDLDCEVHIFGTRLQSNKR